MKLSDIHHLLWLHPNPWTYEKGTVARCGEEFNWGICYNENFDGTMSSVTQFQSRIYRPQISFWFDSLDVHLEDLRLIHKNQDGWHFAVPAVWTAEHHIGFIREQSYLSLRVLGYLVDCWAISSLVTYQDGILSIRQDADIRRTALPSIMPQFGHGEDQVGRYIKIRLPARVDSDKLISFRYGIDYNQDDIEITRYFRQHYRNFFLSLIRRNTATTAC